MGFYADEFKSVMKLGIFFGQLPLVLPISNKVEELKLKIFSITTFFYIALFGVVTGTWITDLADLLSTGRNYLFGFKLFANFLTLRISLRLKVILTSIEDFDNDLFRLTSKKLPQVKTGQRQVGWILLIFFNGLISLITTKPHLTVRYGTYYALLNMTRNIFFLLYCVLCISLATRQYYLSRECKLFFERIRKSTDNDQNVLTLLKIRHLHLKLVTCCDTFNEIFSVYNLAISLSVFVECITIFTELYMLYIENITVVDVFGVTTTCMTFVSEIIHHIALVALSNLLKTYNDKVRYSVSKGDYTNKSVQFNKELKLFLKQMEALPVKITACDLFSLEYATIPPFGFSLLANFLLVVQSQPSIREELLSVFFPNWLLPASSNTLNINSNYTYY